MALYSFKSGKKKETGFLLGVPHRVAGWEVPSILQGVYNGSPRYLKQLENSIVF